MEQCDRRGTWPVLSIRLCSGMNIPEQDHGMPYKKELASKSSHYDIVRNVDVTEFLETCEYLQEPSDEEAKNITAAFAPLPPLRDVTLPARVIAVDGSPYEASINDRLPSTKVGYIKVGVILIDMRQFSSLRVWDG